MPKRIDDDDYIVVRDIADDGPEDEGRAVNVPSPQECLDLEPIHIRCKASHQIGSFIHIYIYTIIVNIGYK